MTRGRDPADFDCLAARVAIGTTAFLEKARGLVGSTSREQPDRNFAVHLIPFQDIVAAVVAEKGEPWEAFRSRYGDWGRDMVLYLARQRSGLTLRQIGDLIGGVDYKVVGKAVQRMRMRLEKDRSLAARAVGILENVE